MINVNDIITLLKENNYLEDNIVRVERLKSGTTNGILSLIFINDIARYVIKQDSPSIIQPTVEFLHTYKTSDLLQDVLYTDIDWNYTVYPYVEGITHQSCGSKKEWMSLLVTKLLNAYHRASHDTPWGRINSERVLAWGDFNQTSYDYARETIGTLIPEEDHKKVEQLLVHLRLVQQEDEKYYQHGDTGVHNFVFYDNKLRGVIDPSPIIAPILYDFTYAFCSSPDNLDLDTLLHAFSQLHRTEKYSEERLIEETVFQLYTRLAICKNAHPYQMTDYLSAWKKWIAYIS